jgi:hypothetical protein
MGILLSIYLSIYLPIYLSIEKKIGKGKKAGFYLRVERREDWVWTQMHKFFNPERE